MSKNDPLRNFLNQTKAAQIPMRFKEIESLLGYKLPSSAWKYQPWWSNNPSNNPLTRVWLNAGYKSENVDMAGETLVFRRVRHDPGSAGNEPQAMVGEIQNDSGRNIRPNGQSGGQSIVGVLKGTVTFDVDTDLTDPIDDRWNAGA